MSHIGERIKKLRKERKLTLSEVAKDKLSPAMVSLIENGKSKPSAENLEHIAKVLKVDISELLGEITREELREELESARLQRDDLNAENLEQSLFRLKELLPNLGHNVESAQIYEIYARYLFLYFQLYKPRYELLGDNDWEKYYGLAEDIYRDFQMENRVLGVRLQLAQTEDTKGNYQKTIDMIDQSLKLVNTHDSYDVKSDMIGLKLLKIGCLEALGKMEESFRLLDEVIAFANKHVVLDNFPVIYNMGAIMHYQAGNYDAARDFLDKINKFFELVDNTYLKLDNEINSIHFMEFYEDHPEKALQMITAFENEYETINEVFDKRIDDFLSDTKARCYTKLKRPQEALPLFRNLMKEYHIQLHPTDIALREVNKSYQALCYMQLNRREEAVQYAKEAVQLLQKYPHTAYYHFARDVLQDVRSVEE